MDLRLGLGDFQVQIILSVCPQLFLQLCLGDIDRHILKIQTKLVSGDLQLLDDQAGPKLSVLHDGYDDEADNDKDDPKPALYFVGCG